MGAGRGGFGEGTGGGKREAEGGSGEACRGGSEREGAGGRVWGRTMSSTNVGRKVKTTAAGRGVTAGLGEQPAAVKQRGARGPE